MVSYAAGLAVAEPGHFAFATAQKFINQTAVVRCVCVCVCACFACADTRV